ncbi:MAG: LssY C-terminal domain-containing protein [Planctomycetes bacterium]|nr:LssY C-terminal domain-containing protein [Planctomycetota bacterium]
MDATFHAGQQAETWRNKVPTRRRVAVVVAIVLLLYLAAAYLAAPAIWKQYVDRHPSLDDIPGVTHTKDGIPGDPINVALIGSETDVKEIMAAAGWYPADSLSIRSDLRIAADTVFEREYDEAPVSSLYLFGRKEDLAFEQPVGPDPRHRNHVRFWRSDKADPDGRPVWVGSASYDDRVGLSHRTGEITHHIAPDVDAERDHLFQDLQQTGDLSEDYAVNDFHKILRGRNGGGDPWYTDGALRVGVISLRQQ